MPDSPKVAIAHDYLTQRGGAEKVVLAMARAFPEAPIYTTLYNPDTTYPEFKNLDIRTSPLNRIRYFAKNHRLALPILPFVASSITIDADVVLSSSSGWAHGFRTSGRKVVYCYSPARWLYQTDAYLGEKSAIPTRLAINALRPILRRWDQNAAQSADIYLAISSVVKNRIRETYGIASSVVPAPQLLDASLESESVASVLDWEDSGYYLCVSRLLPYKNVDKVVRAFDGSPDRLVVVGSGPEEEYLQGIATQNVRLIKDLSDPQVRWIYAHSKGLLAASYEDFGLTPLEAAAYGKPSAVLRWGGFLDTVREGITGVFFDNPEPGQIADAIQRMDETHWSVDAILAHLDQFSEEKFVESLSDALAKAYLVDSVQTSFNNQKDIKL